MDPCTGACHEDAPTASADPPGIASLGRAAWMVLHTQAAENDSSVDFKRYVQAFSRTYPCSTCRPQFIETVNSARLDCGSPAEASETVCKLHNAVNAAVGGLQFPCVGADLVRMYSLKR